MKFLATYIRDVLYILDQDRAKLLKFVAMFIVLSGVDLIGLGLIGPFIAATLDPESMPEQIKALSGWILEKPDQGDYLLV
ncbi:MAG: hypothetical protein VXY99_02255, partial [Pseudomonadota bacterium]|nr:hypothetical protein [Pseudomonadota bacterium]